MKYDPKNFILKLLLKYKGKRKKRTYKERIQEIQFLYPFLKKLPKILANYKTTRETIAKKLPVSTDSILL